VMHDNDFLTLPVCESDGRVVGLVDVMDVIYGCGGAEGWRSIFSSAMDFNDDISEVSSLQVTLPGASKIQSDLCLVKEAKKERPVSQLRPRKPLLSSVEDTVLVVTQMLTNKRGDASLVVDAS